MVKYIKEFAVRPMDRRAFRSAAGITGGLALTMAMPVWAGGSRLIGGRAGMGVAVNGSAPGPLLRLKRAHGPS